MTKSWKPLVLAVAVAAVASAMLAPRPIPIRSVLVPQSPPPATPAAPFDRAQSAALFVGVREFTKDKTLEVPYAVDDAIDLAYTFALDPRVSLVPPERVVLALSGRPQKPESQQRLDQLQAAGVQVRSAEQSDILLLLQQQAVAAGRNGIFILSLATHGFSRDGMPYVLAAGSLFRYPDTALSTARLFDIAATTEASRSLLFLDACRERIADGTRAAGPDPTAAAPLIYRMQRIHGQVVFYAAAAGQYAYDDPVTGNGVFTKAVIDGLQCRAAAPRGVVTVDTLREYVEREVRQWIREHRDPTIGAAIQVSMDGDTPDMPLSICSAGALQTETLDDDHDPITAATQARAASMSPAALPRRR